MTRSEVMMKAMQGTITWIQAAHICGVSARHMRRMKERFEEHGFDGLCDHRGGRPRRKRVPVKTVQKVMKLRQEKYMEFSVKHFWEFATEKHGVKLSYNWTRVLLQQAGLAERSEGRGTHRRKRERRPLRGMMVHCDASMHPWVFGHPSMDLVLMQDDATSDLLYGAFVPQEGTHSTLVALAHVLIKHGRFGEFYTDRGSHFCQTSVAGRGPDSEQHGQVSRVLKTLGITHILARSPQARGRSERTFGTFQNRLPQELKLENIIDYAHANRYLNETFIPDYNRRFTVKPPQPESAFVPLAGINVELLLSVQHPRVVNCDNTVQFNTMTLQLPKVEHRTHFAKCPVLVHQLLDHSLAVSYLGTLLANIRGHETHRFCNRASCFSN